MQPDTILSDTASQSHKGIVMKVKPGTIEIKGDDRSEMVFAMIQQFDTTQEGAKLTFDERMRVAISLMVAALGDEGHILYNSQKENFVSELEKVISRRMK